MGIKNLSELQSAPLEYKELIRDQAIEEWYEEWRGDVYVAVSGRDSMVLLHAVRSIFPKVPALYVDTGVEFPEVRAHARKLSNTDIIRPKKRYSEVVDLYGHPVISKKISMGVSRYRNTKSPLQKELRLWGGINPTSGKKQAPTISKKWHFLVDAPFKISERCCDILKKDPFKRYEKETTRKPFIGTMAVDSDLRRQQYIKHGCNAFDMKAPKSTPLGMYTGQDIAMSCLRYNLDLPTIYYKGYDNTGCIDCMFGVHMEPICRWKKLSETHPRLHKTVMRRQGHIIDYLRRNSKFKSDN